MKPEGRENPEGRAGNQPEQATKRGGGSSGDSPPLHWRQKAECLGADTQLFFKEEKGRGPHYLEGIEFCRRCDVTEECLEFAMRMHPIFGLWGGLSLSERKRLRTKRNRT